VTRLVESLAQDLKYTVRSLAKAPLFTLVAVATLALGIGANTATFSVVYGVLLKGLPYPEADRLVAVWERSQQGRDMQAAWPDFADWREQARSFTALAAYSSGDTTVLGADRPLVTHVAAVSQDFFAVFGVAPARGRAPLPEEHRVGAPPVAVVSQAFWRGHLGGDADLSRHRLDVDGASFAVVGVLPAGFSFPAGAEVWVPLESSGVSSSRTAHNHRVVGRLAPGVTVARAQEDLARITAGIVAGEAPDDYLLTGAVVRGLQEEIGRPVRRPLLILLGAAALVLLVACANLAGTFLARGAQRRREMALRRALGASRRRLLRQLFTESLLVALVGAGLGLLACSVLLDALPELAPAALPRLGEVGLDGAVLAFTLAASVATAVLFGLLPALRVAEGGGEELRGGGRGSADRTQRRTWSVLVASEVALALVLLVGSGLLVRSFWRLLAVDLGFSPAGVATVDLQVPDSRYPEAKDLAGYYDRLVAALEAEPGVEGAGVVSSLPLAGAPNGRLEIEGGPQPTADATYRVADRGYFRTLGIPLLRGRWFAESDVAGAPHVAVINQAMAAAAWPGEDPIGKRLTGGGMDAFWNQNVWATVVGVVGDVHDRSLAAAPEPGVYFALAQRPGRARYGTVVVKAKGSLAAIAPGVREAVERVDPEVPVKLGTMAQVVSQSLADRRFALLLLGAFAAVGLLLALVGIYGVVGYAVARRRRELGIRLALGAAPVAVRNLVVRQSMAAVGAGAAVGAAAALALSRLLGSLLYEVGPADPPTFAAMAAILLSAALVASYLPARRTARIDPMETLRAE
jgi:putative ABC transport system permease protein